MMNNDQVPHPCEAVPTMPQWCALGTTGLSLKPLPFTSPALSMMPELALFVRTSSPDDPRNCTQPSLKSTKPPSSEIAIPPPPALS
jgi:hypothetical protein